jgi:16S rRNA (guanine1516-N2)-methyltransferase
MKMPRVVVTCNDCESDVRVDELAARLASELGLRVLRDTREKTLNDYDFSLCVSDSGLALRCHESVGTAPIQVDFDSSALARRVDDRITRQSIARAAGVKPGSTPSIVDATAGLGRDAFLFASLGCRVRALEKDPVIHALLRDGLGRALNSLVDRTSGAASRLRLECGDFLSWDPGTEPPEVVYLDPMFPERRSSARVKKEMFMLQRYFAEQEEAGQAPALLERALEVATRRVVIKRPRKAARVAGRKPTFELTGRSSRFDVYVKV